MLQDFIGDIRNIYNDLREGKTILIENFRSKWEVEGSVGDTYQSLCDREHKKEKGSFYTPLEIVDFMVERVLEEIDFKTDPNIKILDPSCGGGYFLTVLYEGLIAKAEEAQIPEAPLHILKYNLFGYDIDEIAVMITTLELYEKSGVFTENIKSVDYLFEDVGEFDIIIGNPPYMGHKVLTGEYRDRLYMYYGNVFTDKADLSYCFVKKSIESLKPSGSLHFLLSRYILEALNAVRIRSFIRATSRIKAIVDFYGVRLIKGAGIDNIVIELLKDRNKDVDIDFFRFRPGAKGKGEGAFKDIQNRNEKYSRYIKVKQSELDDRGWIFLNSLEQSTFNKITGVELGSLCESYQGIITGCDEAFVLSRKEAEELQIEGELLKPWIKSKNIQSFKVTPSDEVIIYSDDIKPGSGRRALEHIKKYQHRLEQRRECIKGTRMWHQLQWGRSSEIFDDRKLIYPYKASKNRFAIDDGSYFSADIYTIKIKDMFYGSISYEFLTGVLNSSIYEFYIKAIAKKLGEDMYDYYPNKIMTLKIPEYIKEIEDEVKSGHEDLRQRIDYILMDYFNISPEEYMVIRSWCS